MNIVQEAVESSSKIDMIKNYMATLEEEAEGYKEQPWIGNPEYVERALTLLRVISDLQAIVGESEKIPTSIGDIYG